MIFATRCTLNDVARFSGGRSSPTLSYTEIIAKSRLPPQQTSAAVMRPGSGVAPSSAGCAVASARRGAGTATQFWLPAP
eukprot:2319755-Pyramimonas_sp.AAC.1